MIEECDALGVEVVGAYDLRVTAGVAEADRAALEHGDVPDAVFLSQVVRGRKPVPAAANNDDFVGTFRLGIAPGGLPAAVAAEGLQNDIQRRVALHVRPLSPGLFPCRERSSRDTSTMPVRIEYGGDLTEFGRNKLECGLGEACNLHLDIEGADRVPLGENFAGRDVQILEAFEDAGQDAGIGLGRYT